MTIAVSGTREALTAQNAVAIAALVRPYLPHTVHIGDCPTGVDAFVRTWLQDNGYGHHYHRFEADWSMGPKAGPMRNARMLVGVDVLLAFPGPRSKGTLNAIEQAIRRGIETHVYPIGEYR